MAPTAKPVFFVMCSSQVIGPLDSEPNGIRSRFLFVRNTREGTFRAPEIRQMHWGVTNCTRAAPNGEQTACDRPGAARVLPRAVRFARPDDWTLSIVSFDRGHRVPSADRFSRPERASQHQLPAAAHRAAAHLCVLDRSGRAQRGESV